MFTAKEGPVVNGPITVRVPPNQPAIRVQHINEGDTFEVVKKTTANTTTTTPTAAAQARRQTGPAETASKFSLAAALSPTRPIPSGTTASSAETPKPTLAPTIEVVNGPVTFGPTQPVEFQAPPVFVGPNGQRRPIGEALPVTLAKPASSNLIVPPVGTILGGFGQVYEVQLQNNGPLADPSGSISVTFTMLAANEILDPGTLIWDIRQYQGIYYGFVPTWG
jgi:hypothetical protein